MQIPNPNRIIPMEVGEVHEELVEILLALTRVEGFQITGVLVLITYVQLLMTYKALLLQGLYQCLA